MFKRVLIAGLAAITIFSAGVFAGDMSFSDVSEDSWYYSSAMWASEAGLMSGNDGEFRGGDYVTRAELAAVFERYYMMTEMEEGEEEAEEEMEMECTVEVDEETGEETETCVEVEGEEGEEMEEGSEEGSEEEGSEETEEGSEEGSEA